MKKKPPIKERIPVKPGLTAVFIGMLLLPAVTMACVLPTANFTASPTCVALGGNVTFTDLSTACATKTVTAWSWSFAGGTPATSTAQNPVITYSVSGVYSVTLTVTDDTPNTSPPLTKTGYIAVDTLPGTAGISSPANGAVNRCLTQTLNWTAAARSPSGYKLYFGTDAAATNIVNGTNLGAVLTYNPGGLAASTTYYWKIVPVNCKGDALGAVIWSFTTGTLCFCQPSAPTALAATGVGCNAFTANWTSVGGSTTYYLDVATDAGFTSFVAGYNNLNVGNVTTYNVTGLSSGTTYYYRVRSYNGTCNSANSGTITAVTVAPPSVNLGSDAVLCTANILDAGNTGSTYLWSTGATTQTILPSSSGNYSVTVTRCSVAAGDDINITFSYTLCASYKKLITAGAVHNLAVCSTTVASAWGHNACGELGDGTTTSTDLNPPVQVIGLSGIAALAGGACFSLAVKNDGTAWAWGYNLNGQLGDGTTTQRNTPIQVSGLTGVTAIAAGNAFSLAMKNDGTVWAWGINSYGKLGDGTTTQRATPVQVIGAGGVGFLTGITAIAAGWDHSLAVKNDGTAWAWGRNSNGQLGDGTTTERWTPVQISGLTGIVAIESGGVEYYSGGPTHHSLAVRNDGTAWAWGSNGYGQLGDGTNSQRTTPVQVSGITGIVSIERGMYHSFALKDNGTVWAWGRNNFANLGDGTTTDRWTPVQVLGTGGVGFLTGITAIAGGDMHSLALKTGGTVWAWGNNGAGGQLGDGTATNRLTPVQTIGLCNVAPNPLPIELLSFSAVCLGNKAEIRWSTASETNNDYFTIERAINLQGFQNLAGSEWKVVGAVQGAGNSSAIRHYSFIDTDIPSTSNPQPSTFLYYRLKQTDYDGKYEYFNPIASYCRQNAEGITIINIYPNPANATVEFTVSSAENTGGSVAIMDALGRTILKNKLSIQKGLNRFSLDISALSSAVYLIQVKTDTGLYRDQKQLCVE